MKIRSRVISGCIFLLHLGLASDIYQSIRVFEPTIWTINTIGSLGIPLDHMTGKKGVFIDLTVTEDETIELLSRGIQLDILVPDLTAHYKSRNRPEMNRDFPLGSMPVSYKHLTLPTTPYV